VDGAPGDTDKVSANLYYLLGTDVEYETHCSRKIDNCIYYYYHLRDIDKSKEHKIIDDYIKPSQKESLKISVLR